MLSPLELENKRILTNKRKYDRFEMDEYLDMVFENYKELYNEYEEQKKHIKTLSEGIQYYRSIEATMQKALLLAEKTSKETKDAAILKAEAIEKDANNKATQILTTAEQEYTRIREKCIELVTQFNNYKAQLQIAANEQLKLITSATFDIETPIIDRDDNVTASGLEAVGAVGTVEAIGAPPEVPADNSSLFEHKPEPQLAPAEMPPENVAAQEITADHSKSNVYSYSATGNTNPLPDLSGYIEPETATQVNADASMLEPEPQVNTEIPKPEPVQQTFEETPSEPEAVVAAAAPAGEVIAPAETTVAGEVVAPIQTESDTDVSSQFEMFTEVPAAEAVAPQAVEPESVTPQVAEPEPITPQVATNEPVSEKTMVLPDVKDVDREMLRSSKNYTKEEQLQILSAETINLNDSIQAVKEAEMLEVPKREEPEMLILEPSESDAPIQSKPQTGLDTILQSMTIGKKKKSNGESAEDPFEFLGSVDDF